MSAAASCRLYPSALDVRLRERTIASSPGHPIGAASDIRNGVKYESPYARFFSRVEGVEGNCPAGEIYAKQNIAANNIPVLSCEGPCIRGEIARLAANMVAREVPSHARACHAETFMVPHSSMARWVKTADRSVMIDGCFLMCHGRVLKKLIGDEKVAVLEPVSEYFLYSCHASIWNRRIYYRRMRSMGELFSGFEV